MYKIVTERGTPVSMDPGVKFLWDRGKSRVTVNRQEEKLFFKSESGKAELGREKTEYIELDGEEGDSRTLRQFLVMFIRGAEGKVLKRIYSSDSGICLEVK